MARDPALSTRPGPPSPAAPRLPPGGPHGGLSGDSELEPAEWLALLLGEDEALASRLLARRPLRELAVLSVSELIETLDLRADTALRLVAALGLGRGLLCATRPKRPFLHSADLVHELVWPELAQLEKERFLGLYVDGKHRLRELVRVSEGTLTASLVHPREVFRPAIRCAAAGVIVVHNHPSGDPEPSVEDVDVTRRLREAGRVVGIPLLDHVVCAERGFVSLRERLGF